MNAAAPLLGFLIDDDDSAAASAALFSSSALQLSFRLPADLEEFAQQLFNQQPAILVMDYRLDQVADEQGQTRRYKASALTQQLRDLATEHPMHDCPIVLHSAEDKLRDFYRPDQTAHDLFDDIITKDGQKNIEEIRRRLVGLAQGYIDLIAVDRQYEARQLDLLGLTASQHSFVDHQDVQSQLRAAQVPHVMAQFLLKKLIGRNALLLDEPNVLARAGIRSDSPARARLCDALRTGGAEYTGVFASFRPRWWRTAVDDLLETWLGGTASRFTAEQRAIKLSEALNHPFEAAHSTWSGSAQERFTHACAVCAHPTHVAHSVAVLDVGNGVLAERRRVCFDCLQNDRHLRRGRTWEIDALDERVMRDVREGRLARNTG